MTTLATKYPSPHYFLGALVADQASEGLAIKLYESYVDMRGRLDDGELDQWCLQVYRHLKGDGYQYAAMAIIAHPSIHDTDHYQRLANELLERRKAG